MSREKRAQAFEVVERFTQLPMLVLSLIVIVVLMVPVFIKLSPSTEEALEVIQWSIWVVFAVELLVKTYLAESRGGYLRAHWFDAAIVLLPFLRPLRIVNSARALRGLRALRVLSLSARAAQSTKGLLYQHGLRYALLIALFLLVSCALLVEHFEQGAGGNIGSFGDALWWAATTITTVGYGDRFPVTMEGRALAVLLMLAGISLFSFLSASIAAFLIQPPKAAPEPTISELLAEIRMLHEKVDSLQARSSVPDLTEREPVEAGA